MTSIKASTAGAPYRIEIKSPTGNSIIADEPVANGGEDKGFSPKELLAAALAACTCATVSMYAGRKSWNLEQVAVAIELNEINGQTQFIRQIDLTGTLDEIQRARLLSVANACPLHKILTNSITITTMLVP